MRQRRHHERNYDPEFSALLEDIKTLIRSSRQKRTGELPHPLGEARDKVVIHRRSITITDSAGHKVAVISHHWIPLLERLESVRFTREELTALDWSVFDEEHTPEKRSQEIVTWARNLGKKSGKTK